MTDFRTRRITANLPGVEGSLTSGQTLQNRYLIMGVLGVGGMGSVYQARDLHFPNVTKLVAVKEMMNLAPDPALREMIVRNFEREANLLATLSHPSIPKIYDLFSHKDRSYLVMEYIAGKDLEAVLTETEGFLPETQVVEWALQLCDVLTYLHSHQPDPIVFRDMKPSNVMIDERKQVRLIDFGIARGFQAGQRGTMIGTEGYSPPEQYRGEAGPPGDLYALGATLHHLLSKRDPRLEPPFSFSERPIRTINPAVSPELEIIINTALAYEPTERFSSAAAMKAALSAMRSSSLKTSRVSISTAPVGATAVLPAGAPANTVVPLWEFACEDEIRGQPLPVGKNVYLGVYDHNLYALSKDGGKFVWKFAAEGGFAASPIYESPHIYIGAEDGKLYALTTETGRQVWQYATGGSIRSTARAAQGHVFVGSDDAHLHAVNTQNGRAVWRYEASGAIRSRPALADKESRVFFGCESGEFFCLDFSGSLKWRFRSKRAMTSSPAMGNGIVVVGSADYNVYALDANTGWAVWKTRTQKPVVSSPALTDKAVFIGSADGSLYSLDLRSGKLLWKFDTGDQVASSPVVYKSGVYFGSVDGFVYCVDIATGKLRWKFKTDGAVISSPAVTDDVVYVGSTDHKLYALTA